MESTQPLELSSFIEMPNFITVDRRAYKWSFVCGSREFKKFYDRDILRISSIEESFDVAIRIDYYSFSWLGPLLVLAGDFPNQKMPLHRGVLLQLRPKLCRLKGDLPDAATAERVVQWCGSPRFRVKRINIYGWEWIGDEAKYAKYDDWDL